ncbi:DUF4083 family protein [Solibacillus sp. FSL R7-0668]|uniref:DUF4083 family protein n=1 Tax=Solibacillus sp. FSL R7-0668 TaxID=2921688 RepID=UPI0030F565CC
MTQVNLGDIIATFVVLALWVLLFISFFLFIKNMIKRSSQQQRSTQNVEETLQTIQKQNEEIIELLKKMNNRS